MINLPFINDNPQIAIYAMLVACFLPVVFAGIAKASGGFKSNDNANPRAFLSKLSGLPARANAVQQNSYETLPMFFASVIIAMMMFVPQQFVNNLACLYILLRILYGVAYLLDLALFRSIVWILSMACVAMLFLATAHVLA